MEEFITMICEELNINIPKVSYDTSVFATNTTLAMIDVKNHILYLSNVESLDKYFAIAHELRHAWQFKYHKNWFKDYKQSNQLSITNYNKQIVEIDANAYAMLIMEDIFNISPIFNGFPRHIIELIENRADEICCEML